MKSFRDCFSTFVNRQIVSILAAISMCVFFAGCDKDEEEIPSPRIIVERPFEQELIFSQDTVLVKATVNHAVNVEWVEVELVDAEYRPIGGKQQYTVSGKEVAFEGVLIIDEPLLSSGLYHVAVRASDGSKTGTTYQRVQLAAIPRMLERTLIATRSTFNVDIWSDEGGAWNQLFSKNIDCRGVALNYRQNLLATVGGEIGDLDFHEMEKFEVINSLQGLGTPSFPFFLGAQYERNEEEFLILMREPRLRVYDMNALPKAGFELVPDHIPSRVFSVGDHYYIVERPIGIPSIRLVQYTRIGVRLAFLEVQGEVKGMFERNSNEIFLWENHPGGCKLRLLNTDNQLISDIFQRPDEMLIDVVEIGTGLFIFLTDQALYRYNYANGGTALLQQGPSAGSALFYEPLGQLLYLAAGNQLSVATLNGDVVQTHSFSQEVFWVGFDYNR